MKDRTGVESRTEASRKLRGLHPLRHRQRAAAPDEQSSIAGRGAHRVAHVGECDPVRELRVVGVGREDGSRGLVEPGRHVDALVFAGRTEHPVVVGHETEAPRRRSRVDERQDRELHGIGRVDEHLEVVLDAAVGAAEARDAGRMADDGAAARPVAPDRSGRRGPDFARLVVSNEPRFGRRIGHRVVGERASGGSRGCSPPMCATSPRRSRSCRSRGW